jgi:hypothetical protein
MSGWRRSIYCVFADGLGRWAGGIGGLCFVNGPYVLLHEVYSVMYITSIFAVNLSIEVQD